MNSVTRASDCAYANQAKLRCKWLAITASHRDGGCPIARLCKWLAKTASQRDGGCPKARLCKWLAITASQRDAIMRKNYQSEPNRAMWAVKHNQNPKFACIFLYFEDQNTGKITWIRVFNTHMNVNDDLFACKCIFLCVCSCFIHKIGINLGKMDSGNERSEI